MNMQDKPRKVTSEHGFLELATILSGFLLAAAIFWGFSISFQPTIDWRDSIQLQLENDTFFHYENGTLGEEFNGTDHDLVPGDLLILGPVSFTHFHTLSSTACYSTYSESDSDSYSYEDDYECYTSYWDELTFDAAGINFTVSENHRFMKTCFNAFCKVNATVNGDEYGLGYSSERLRITVQEFTWVRWCQGEGVCQ